MMRPRVAGLSLALLVGCVAVLVLGMGWAVWAFNASGWR